MNNNNEIKMNAIEQKLDRLSKRTVIKDYIGMQAAWQNMVSKFEITCALLYLENPKHAMFDKENDMLSSDMIAGVKKNLETGKFDMIFKNIGVVR